MRNPSALKLNQLTLNFIYSLSYIFVTPKKSRGGSENFFGNSPTLPTPLNPPKTLQSTPEAPNFTTS